MDCGGNGPGQIVLLVRQSRVVSHQPSTTSRCEHRLASWWPPGGSRRKYEPPRLRVGRDARAPLVVHQADVIERDRLEARESLEDRRAR